MVPMYIENVPPASVKSDTHDQGLVYPFTGRAGLMACGSTADLREQLELCPDHRMFVCAHVGPSMNPTLCEHDLLEVMPYGSRQARAGDVALLLPPAAEQPVVHRVIRVSPEGILTRGDNNDCDDPWLLEAGDILGRVTAARRGMRRRPIPGGRRGALIAWFTHLVRAFDRRVSVYLNSTYRSLSRRGVLRRLLPSRLRPQVVVFGTGAGLRLRLLLGQRVLGAFDADQGQWDIKRPFRLFIDERSLPQACEIGQDARPRG